MFWISLDFFKIDPDEPVIYYILLCTYLIYLMKHFVGSRVHRAVAQVQIQVLVPTAIFVCLNFYVEIIIGNYKNSTMNPFYPSPSPVYASPKGDIQ